MCQAFISNNANIEHTQRNLQDYRKEQHEKVSKVKTESRVHKIILQMIEDGVSNQEISPYINMAYALKDGSDYNSDYSANSESTSEWETHIGMNIFQPPVELEPPHR